MIVCPAELIHLQLCYILIDHLWYKVMKENIAFIRISKGWIIWEWKWQWNIDRDIMNWWNECFSMNHSLGYSKAGCTCRKWMFSDFLLKWHISHANFINFRLLKAVIWQKSVIRACQVIRHIIGMVKRWGILNKIQWVPELLERLELFHVNKSCKI